MWHILWFLLDNGICSIEKDDVRHLKKHKLRYFPVRYEFLEPDHAWAIDFMQLQDSLYLCKVVDDCTLYSLASSLSSSPSTLASIVTINKAISSTGSIPKVLKSDRETCFTSQPFASYLNEHNIFHLKSFPRYPRCNAKIERIFRDVSTNVRTCISPNNSIVDILNACNI